jgi:hypothetical protein
VIEFALHRVSYACHERARTARRTGGNHGPGIELAQDAPRRGTKRPRKVVHDPFDALLSVFRSRPQHQIDRRAKHCIDAAEIGDVAGFDGGDAIDTLKWLKADGAEWLMVDGYRSR